MNILQTALHKATSEQIEMLSLGECVVMSGYEQMLSMNHQRESLEQADRYYRKVMAHFDVTAEDLASELESEIEQRR